MELGTLKLEKKKKKTEKIDFHVLQQWTSILSILNDNQSQNKLLFKWKQFWLFQINYIKQLMYF